MNPDPLLGVSINVTWALVLGFQAGTRDVYQGLDCILQWSKPLKGRFVSPLVLGEPVKYPS